MALDGAEREPREAMDCDVVVVGAGPAGLATAIRLKQLAAGAELSVIVLEKGSEVGAHILSGAVIDPIGLDSLMPDWKAKGAPVETPVTEDRFYYLGPSGALRIPNLVMPPLMNNHGNYIVSLGNLVRWLGEQAAGLGVDIYPEFAASEVLYDEAGAVVGVATGDKGVGRNGAPTDRFQRGMRAQGQVHRHRRGRARLARQDAGRAVRAGEGPRAAEVRSGPQGAVGGAARKAPAGARAAYAGVATRRPHRRRLLPLPLRRQPGVGRLRGAPQLRQPLPLALRRVPALQDAPDHPRHLRGRPADRLRRARADRGRLAIHPAAGLSRRVCWWAARPGS